MSADARRPLQALVRWRAFEEGKASIDAQRAHQHAHAAEARRAQAESLLDEVSRVRARSLDSGVLDLAYLQAVGAIEAVAAAGLADEVEACRHADNARAVAIERHATARLSTRLVGDRADRRRVDATRKRDVAQYESTLDLTIAGRRTPR